METRRSILMEALKAVENERLAKHELFLAESDASSVYTEDTGDQVYSRAIRDAEDAIRWLITATTPDQPKGENS